MRSGFTMIEALFALVMFQIGILALLSSGTVIARDMAMANRRARAEAVATSRVELMRATCPAPRAGHAAPSPGVAEYWRVEGAGITRAISDSVEYDLPGGRSSRLVIR